MVAEICITVYMFTKFLMAIAFVRPRCCAPLIAMFLRNFEEVDNNNYNNNSDNNINMSKRKRRITKKN